MSKFVYVKKAVGLAMLKGEVADEIAADPRYFVPAMVIIACPAFVASIFAIAAINMMIGVPGGGAALTPQVALFIPLIKKASYGLVILFVLLSLLVSIFWAGFLHIIAKLFKGEGKFLDYYQTLGIGSFITCLAGLPYIGLLISLWMIPVTVVVTSRVHRLSIGKAVAVVLVPLALAFLAGIFLAAFVSMGALTGMMGQEMFKMTH